MGLECRKSSDIRNVRNSGDTRLKHDSDPSMKDGQVLSWASFRVAKTGQLRIPVFPCRLGHFGKIDLGTDFKKTASNASAFQGVELGFPHSTFPFRNVGSVANFGAEPNVLSGSVRKPATASRVIEKWQRSLPMSRQQAA